MAKIKLTEDQLNRLVEMEHKSVFKDEHKMKDAVESHLSEEKEVCGCGCEIGKCECGPECTKCDCGKKKEAKEDWDPTGSVGAEGVAQDVARKGMNTLWETELSYGSDYDNPHDDYHSEKEQYRVAEVLYEIGQLLFSIGRHEESEKYRQSAINNAPDWDETELPPYGDTPKYEIPGMKDSMNDLDDLVNSVKRKGERRLTLNDFERLVRSDMMAGAAMDEYVSDEKVKKAAKSYYHDYLQGADPEKMFSENKKPKWVNETKNNFKRLIK